MLTLVFSLRIQTQDSDMLRLLLWAITLLLKIFPHKKVARYGYIHKWRRWITECFHSHESAGNLCKCLTNEWAEYHKWLLFHSEISHSVPSKTNIRCTQLTWITRWLWVCVFSFLNLPDQIPPADWRRPYWRHDPTSGRWTAPLPCGQPDGEEKQASELLQTMKSRLNQWQMWDQNCYSSALINTHPAFAAFYFDLDSFWYAILSSPQPFTWGQSGLNKKFAHCTCSGWICTKEIRVFYRVPSRDAGVAALQTSSLDFSLVQLLPSV